MPDGVTITVERASEGYMLTVWSSHKGELDEPRMALVHAMTIDECVGLSRAWLMAVLGDDHGG